MRAHVRVLSLESDGTSERAKQRCIFMSDRNQMEQLPNQGTLEEICDVHNLMEAFKAVKRNKGAPGIDGITIEEYEVQLSENIEHLRQEVLNWTYQPQPVKRVEIPKPDGKGMVVQHCFCKLAA